MRKNSRKQIKNFSRSILLFHIVAPLIQFFRFIFSSRLRNIECSHVENCTSNHGLLFEIWWPGGDPNTTPTYYFIIIWQLATLATIVSNVAASDAFLCSLAIAASERCDLLIKDAARALLPGQDSQITPSCCNWLKYHQYYIKIVASLNSVLGPVFFFTVCNAVLSIILLSYTTAKANDFSLLTSTSTVMTVMLGRLFALAYAGQRIHTKSEKLSRSVWNEGQASKGSFEDGPARTMLLVLVTRLSGGMKPEVLSGLGYFALTLEFYTKILSLSISLWLILLQL